MSTEKNTPDDETQVVDAIQPPPDATTDDTQVIDATNETAQLDAVYETQVVDSSDEDGTPTPTPTAATSETLVDATGVAADDNQAVDAEHLVVAEPDRPAGGVPAGEPFDLFATAPEQSPSTQPEPAPPIIVSAAAPEPGPGPRSLRVGTVVWGLILAACGLGVIAWASGARIDFQLALIILLAVAGTALLVGSIVSGARHARH